MKTVGAPGRTQNPLSVSGYQALAAARAGAEPTVPGVVSDQEPDGHCIVVRLWNSWPLGECYSLQAQ